jgi:hypothetical protein
MAETGFEFRVVKVGLNHLFCGTVGIFLESFVLSFSMESTKPALCSIDFMTTVIVSESSLGVSGTIIIGGKFSGKRLSVRGVVKEMEELLHSMGSHYKLGDPLESEFCNPLSRETLETIGSSTKGEMTGFSLIVSGLLANLGTGLGFVSKLGS